MKQAIKAFGRDLYQGLAPRSVRERMPLAWQAKLARLTGARAPFVPPPLDGKVRLNLGSGDMSLPGYLNVDQAPERDGHRPDIVSDVMKLDLADAYADEIMAIHVFEHFFLWDVDNVLAEWKRVLKPGGRLVLELPDLLKSARNFLKHPDTTDPKKWQLSMYGFYGDPSWAEPVMNHKWGWTPTSLEAKLRDCGFVEIRHSLPRFHQLARDMRVTAVKPSNN